MNKILEYLNSVPMIIISGLFLIISLIEHIGLMGDFHFPVYPDPSWVAILVCGIPILYHAIWSLAFKKGMSRISSSLLISMAMIASILIDEVFAAGEIAWIMAIGEYLEERTVKRTKKGIESLLKLIPQQGRRIKTMQDGIVTEEIVEAAELRPGDVIRVLPGETITADGRILYGKTSVDQSIITGESLPIDKTESDSVYTGTINRFGSIDVEITKDYQDSSLQKMIRLVQDAEENKAPMQKTVDIWASWLVPIALLIAIMTYFITTDIIRAVTVLVVFCPCALALATPTSIVAAIGQAAKSGVLIKSGEALEIMGKITTVAFDKTGTLTQGKLVVSDVTAFGVEENELLLLTASAESRSEHPLGKAIVNFVKNDKNIDLTESESFTMTIGKGVAAVINGRKIICGNEKLVTDDNGIPVGGAARQVTDSLRSQGKAVILVADAEKLIGILALSDVIKEQAPAAISRLKAVGVSQTILLTGDNEKTAQYIADQAGITNVRASLLPEEKVESIADIINNGRDICMVGDGVNDAPALKTASVGIAMGTMGSDIAIDAADIALMGDDITKIPYIKRLSNATINTIKLNIAMALAINLIAIVLSVLGYLTPVTGALVHNAGSVLVVLNAARLYERKYADR